MELLRSVMMHVCLFIQKFFIFSKKQKMTSEMSIIMLQETVLGLDFT